MKYYILGLILLAGTQVFAQSIDGKKALRDIEILSSDVYKGRKTGTFENQMAADVIIKRFKESGIQPFTDYKVPFTFNSRDGKALNGTNLIGYIKGKTDKVIVISAHYDHIGIIKELIYNGADDNASGVAGLLAIAAYYSTHKPEHTLVFAAFDGEEIGLQGAKAFVQKPPVPLSKIKLNINMDMISHNDKAELYVCGTRPYPELKKYVFTSNPNIKVLMGHDDPKSGHEDWTNQSDQGPFNEKKIPFLYFGVEDHPDYHKSTDEYQNINKAFFVDAVNAILQITENIDKNKSLLKDKLIMKSK